MELAPRALVLNQNAIQLPSRVSTAYYGQNIMLVYYAKASKQITLEHKEQPSTHFLIIFFLHSERKNPLSCLACKPSVRWQHDNTWCCLAVGQVQWYSVCATPILLSLVKNSVLSSLPNIATICLHTTLVMIM